MRVDYVIVGSGLTGATIARLLTDVGREVVVLDRRSHVGGNVHDSLHPSGIRVHTYGPHYFRTGSKRIWEFAGRFAKFYEFKAELLTLIDGCYEHWPVVTNSISRLAGSDWVPAFSGVPTNFEQASLSMMPKIIYEKFVKGYTEKQWGVPAHTLSPTLAKRFDVRSDNGIQLSRHKYQGLPRGGYNRWMTNMLDGIPILQNMDYLKAREKFQHKRTLIFTGSIDELFSFRLGRLKYRGQRRSHQYFDQLDHYQPCTQVNNPDHAQGPHVRTIEWKYLMEPSVVKHIRGTVVSTETPYTPVDPDAFEYPFPDLLNQTLYRDYAVLAAQVPGLIVCGRLGEYRYYDMDQAIGRAMVIARRLLSGSR